MPVNCWGPTVGAKAVSYKTAVLLGLFGQTLGMICFGDNTYNAYGQFLTDKQPLQAHPLLTMYALMWVTVVPILWHLAGIWQKIILPVYLGNGKLRQREMCPPCHSHAKCIAYASKSLEVHSARLRCFE